MTDKFTDQWVTVAQDSDPLDAWVPVSKRAQETDYYEEVLTSTGQALKMAAQRQGVMRLRLVADLLNELIVQTVAHIRSSEDPAVQQQGMRRLRELRKTLAGLL
jgi:hypothetical protein